MEICLQTWKLFHHFMQSSSILVQGGSQIESETICEKSYDVEIKTKVFIDVLSPAQDTAGFESVIVSHRAFETV